MAASSGRQSKVVRIGTSLDWLADISALCVGVSNCAFVGALQAESPAASRRLARAIEIGALNTVVCVISRLYVRHAPPAR